MSKIIGTSGIAIGDGEGGYIALSVQEKVMENLHQSLATFLQASAPNSGSIIGNGTIVYRIPLYGQTQAYSVGQNATAYPNVEMVSVNVGDYRTQFYELEDFDVSMIKPEVIGQLTGQIAANLSTTIMADQNSHFFLALKEYFDAHPEQTYYVPELAVETVMSRDEKEKLQKELLWIKGKLQKTINQKYIGIKGNEFYGLVDVFGKINTQLLLTGLNLSDKAFDLILYGIGGDTLDTFELGGTKFIVDNFINRLLPQGYSFNGDYTYDMTAYKGFMIHNEFMAFPMGLQKIVSVINPNNGNMRWIAKYAFGHGVLRPELGAAFVDSLHGSVDGDFDESGAPIAGNDYTITANLVCTNLVDENVSLENCELVSVSGNVIVVRATATDNVNVTIKYNGASVIVPVSKAINR